jgi:hypothetical protein
MAVHPPSYSKTLGDMAKIPKKGFTSRGCKLRTPLGPWTKVDTSWPWFFSPSQVTLFHHCNHVWTAFSCLTQRGSRIHFSDSGQVVSNYPDDLHRASVYKCQTKYVLFSYSRIPSPSLGCQRFLRDFLLNYSDDERPFFHTSYYPMTAHSSPQLCKMGQRLQCVTNQNKVSLEQPHGLQKALQ